LQYGLREPICTEREPDQRVVAPSWKRFGVQREHRQDDEHAEHAQAEDAREAGGGAPLGGSHPDGRGVGGRRAVVRHGRAWKAETEKSGERKKRKSAGEPRGRSGADSRFGRGLETAAE
jgi:hypothetical protein